MKRVLKRTIRNIRSYLVRSLTTVSPRGSGLGRATRRTLRTYDLRRIIGVNLAGFTFLAGIVMPQSFEAIASLEVAKETEKTVVIADTSPSRFQWPLKTFGISQGFAAYHPGIDMTDPTGTPVYPIGPGTVAWVQSFAFGYGNHLVVAHESGIQSLYAHLSVVDVKENDEVTKKTKLGEVGTTGWSTGSHLHLETYQNNTPVNPVEILPAIK